MPKISELNAITSVANNDLLMVVHDPSGLPSTNKITVNNFVSSVSTQLRGYTGSSGLGYTGSIGSGYTGSAGTSGFTGSAGSSGYTGSIGSGYTGSAGVGLPAGATWGQILAANATGNANWEYNTDTLAIRAVYTTTSNNALANDSILLVVPATLTSPISIVLPANVPPGKKFTVRNVYSGEPNGTYPVVVTSVGGSGLIEDPHFGSFTNTFNIQFTGDTHTWVFDGTYYRSLTPLTQSPVFLVSANTYHQVALKNYSIANNASGDFVVYNDQGDHLAGTGPFIDMGINSSNYTDTTYGNVWGPNDAYLYNTGGDLVIGPQDDYSIQFVAGNTNSDSIRLVVNSTSVYVNNTLTIVNSAPGASPEISSIYSTTNLVLTANDQTFKLSTNGSITFPDNTSQNTAFTKSKTLTTISVVGPTTITNDVTFADPNAAGANVNLILPSSPSSGRVYTVKNINAGGSVVYVQTNGTDNMENEAGSIGSGIYATISTSGDYITWVYDGGSSTYRIIG